jgi:hypothetical protein
MEAAQRLRKTVRIDQTVKPERLVAGLAQSRVQTGKPERENRFGRRAAVGTDEKDAAGHGPTKIPASQLKPQCQNRFLLGRGFV